MKKLFLIPLLLLALSAGCATTPKEPPEIVAGKTLLAIKDNIIMIRDGFGVPCQQGLVAAADCQSIDSLYQQSKPLYDMAVSAEQIALASGKAEDAQAYENRKQALIGLVVDMSNLAAKYGVKGGAN
jgi:hypothetical protein